MEHKGQLLFPAGFAVGAAGHDAGGEVDAAGKNLGAHLAEAFPHPLVVAHLLGAVVHVEDGAGGELGAGGEVHQSRRGHPEGRGERRCPAKDVVVGQQGVQAHQAAHGAAADEGVAAVRLGAEIGVDVGLELPDEPVEGLAALAIKVAVVGVVKTVGRILHQPLVVGSGVALDGRHDEGRIGVIEVIGHAPAFAVGGVLIKEDVLAVEHIEHRVAAVGVCLVHGRQIDIHAAVFLTVDRRIADRPFLDHFPNSLSFFIG